nr:MAG TPA: hypothetical protein [Caudoviricetes sp.]
MSTQLTIIIVVAIICATSVVVFYYNSEVKRLKGMFSILQKLVEKNERLNKDLDEAYEGWIREIRITSEKCEGIVTDLFELQQKLKP